MNLFSHLQLGLRRQIPLILQTETTECGLACLAMVAGWYGNPIELVRLRHHFAPSLRGTTLKQLMDISQHIHLMSRPLKLALHELTQLKLPCILHWNMNHFVVLTSVHRDRIVIHDPAQGKRTLHLSDVSKHFTGVALELTPSRDFEPSVAQPTLRVSQLFGKVIGLKRSLFHVFALTLLLEFCSIASPFYLQWVIDEVLVTQDHPLLVVLGMGFLLLVVVQTLIGTLRRWVLVTMSTHLSLQWTSNVFSHLLSLPVSWFEKRHLGDILSRFGSTKAIQQTLTTSFVEVAIDSLLALSTLAMMLLYSAKLATITFAVVILYTLLRFMLYQPMKTAMQEELIRSSEAQSSFMESVRGIMAIKLFNRTEERRVVWLNHVTDQLNTQVRQQKLSLLYQGVKTLLFGMERVAVIWLGALAVMESSLTIGMLFVYLSYKDQFSTRVLALVDKALEFRLLRLHSERLADIVLNEPEEKLSVVSLPPSELTLALEDVSFRYSALEPAILEHITFTVHPGECVAITGSSGGGKTTLAKLILGVLDPTEGQIKIGRQTLRQTGLAHYRQLLGSVMQEDRLFAGSVTDNITFFDMQPEQERVIHCAKLAALHHDILSMPMGYYSLVGDMGTALSGGQKQRLLLARALYKNPKILVLDEATSHLDVYHEQQVNHAVKQLNITRIIIAHRPETIAMADRVLILEKGKIVEDRRQHSSLSSIDT